MNNITATEAMSIATRLTGEVRSNHPSHSFFGEDGRCLDCDCRPFGRHAPLPCVFV